MTYANIGMRPDYLSQYRRAATQPSSIYSPLQSVSGLRPQEPSDIQQAVGALSMANTANSAVKGLTGFDPAKSVASQIKELLASDSSLAQDIIGKPTYDAAYTAADTLDLPSNFSVEAPSLDWSSNAMGDFGDYDYSGIGSTGYDFFSDGASAASDAGDWASNSFNGTDFGGGSIPYLNIATNLMDGSWGWGDTGSVVGSYFGGPIGATVGRFIGEPVGDVIEGVGGAIGDAVEGVGDFLGDLGGGGCFLTTACMYEHGNNFADDSRELTALRDVRDNYIRNIEGGPELIKAYYDKAPGQVKQLTMRPDSKEVFKKMYHEYITPAVEQAESGDYEGSYKTYLKLVDWVNKETEEV